MTQFEQHLPLGGRSIAGDRRVAHTVKARPYSAIGTLTTLAGQSRRSGARTRPICRYRTALGLRAECGDAPLHGGRCTASPAVGERVVGAERSRVRAVAAPNGSTERQHRITGDRLAKAAQIGMYLRATRLLPRIGSRHWKCVRATVVADSDPPAPGSVLAIEQRRFETAPNERPGPLARG
jgi:hypothetical protein